VLQLTAGPLLRGVQAEPQGLPGSATEEWLWEMGWTSSRFSLPIEAGRGVLARPHQLRLAPSPVF